LKAVSIERQPTSYYFRDHEVVFWRSDWTKSATAFAFKCGPSEGHHAALKLRQFPDWRLSSGHAHPDANSFIIFARGEYLMGDTGYAGLPLTEHHNTLLIGGKGQAKEGIGHDVFSGVAYERLNQIRIDEVKLEKDRVLVRGDATTAYELELGVRKFVRQFEYNSVDGFTIRDEVELARPAVVTSVLHADASFRKEGNTSFSTTAGNVKLLIEVSEPKDLRSAIEANVVTAPGPPGAVDKGERQERGQKLLLSTRPLTTTRFLINLKLGALASQF
jgi:hypothetical protein